MTKKIKKREAEKKRQLVKEVTETTIVGIESPPVNHHYLRVGNKRVNLSCSGLPDWITLEPVLDVSASVRYCPHCGQRLVIEILADSLNKLLPPPTKGLVENN
jgi:hypothetical protein